MITIEKVWLTDDAIWIRTTDNREASESFADYPRLNNATSEQRKHYTYDQYGISWPELDEDLSFEGFFSPKTKNELYHLFMAHPELNASAIARKMGIAQSLFAQYISGAKKPSKKRLDDIFSTIQSLAVELASYCESLKSKQH